MKPDELIKMAINMRENAYCPYSHFAVGAALLGEDGRVFTGCNIENAAFSPTNCAERTAFFKAVSEGCVSFTHIAIAGGPRGKPPEKTCYPCGVCLQVMTEFCRPDDFQVLLVSSPGRYEGYTLRQLLPHGFNPMA